jgi:hypothetical protein
MAYQYVVHPRHTLTRIRENPVSRASRVSYHQNTFDLLGIAPGEWPEAALMIEKHEIEHGPLPASVREWYLVPNVVSLDLQRRGSGGLQWASDDDNMPLSLPDVLHGFARASRTRSPHIWFMTGPQHECRYYFELNGGADPLVLEHEGNRLRRNGQLLTTPFREFVLQGFVVCQESTLRLWKYRRPDEVLPTYHNGLWLRTPDEPFQPPVIDFLTDHFGEPDRTPRPGDVTTHTFRPPGGTIRVTADHPALTGGLSAWWVHADTPERLAEFATLLRPWGTLRDSLRADTVSAREVLDRFRDNRPA